MDKKATHITQNKGRIIAIGDVHGNADALNILLNKLNHSKDDHLIFLGDYIDRGEASKDVIETLIALSAQTNCTFLCGNHEEILIAALNDPAGLESYFLSNGGQKTLDAYHAKDIAELHKKLPQAHKAFFSQLQDYAYADHHILTHAGWDVQIENKTTLAPEDIETLRYNFVKSANPAATSKTIICGHSTQKSGLPFIQDNVICIDTAYGHNQQSWLTAYDLNNQEFIQVNADGQCRIIKMNDAQTAPNDLTKAPRP